MPIPSVFLSIDDLYKDCYERVKNFPKLDKYLLGNSILRSLVETRECLSAGIFDRESVFSGSAKFDSFKMLLRIAVSNRCVSEEWYASRLGLISGIGTEIGYWVKKSKTPKF